MKKKGWFGVLLALVMAVSIMSQGAATAVFAGGSAKQVDTKITQFKILNWQKEEANKVFFTDSFYLKMDWDASGNGANLHQGDYFDVTLPDQMIFLADSSAVDFNLYAPDGTSVLAKAHVTPKDGGGGTVKVTFTDWVENKYNVKGDMYLAARFDTTKITQNEQNTFSITVNGNVSGSNTSTEIGIVGQSDIHDEYLNKWGMSVQGKPDRAAWAGRINHTGATLHNVVITDTLGDSGETYIKDSFQVRQVVYDSKGNITQNIKTLDLSNILTFSQDGKSFTLDLGDLNGEQFKIYYETTYTSGTNLKNSLKLTSTEKTKEYVATHKSAQSGGSGAGDLANKIKVIKVDSENTETRLADAQFKIISAADGKEYTITTNANGEAVTEKLSAGTYTIQEVKAPFGFQLNSDKITVTVKDGDAVIQTVKDVPVKTSVSVTKKWKGGTGSSVQVDLYADGVKVRSQRLSVENGWKHTFTNLNKYKDGRAIEYTVKEEPVSGYRTEITGGAEEGFVITNTKEEVPVKPQTGDGSDVLLYGGLLVASAAAVFVLRRRYSSHK